MAITSSPQVLSASADAYINAGATTRLQTLTGSTGFITVSIVDGAAIKLVNVTGTTAVTFSNITSGYANQWTVEVVNRGSNPVTFQGVTWDGGVAPTLSTTGKTVVQFYSADGGATIYGKALFLSIF